MHYFYLTFLVLFLNGIRGSICSNLKENVLSNSDTSRMETGDTDTIPILRELINYFQNKTPDDGKDKKSAQNKTNALKNVAYKENLSIGRDMPSSKATVSAKNNDKNIGRNYFHIDPVFNSLKNRRKLLLPQTTESTSGSDSETDIQDWKDEWDEKRLQLKFQAFKSSQPRGDVVNMKAARPWGVQCGDPNQHELPWGTCMLPAECDPEYRIYRGDNFCGRNHFICCALERTTYDMYQGVDLSFQRENSLSTDTEDERDRDSNVARERDRKKRRHDKRKLKRNKSQLKKKIRNSISNIITEITKLLQKAYRNTTNHRTKKANELEAFVKQMKKQYRKDRKTLVDAHEFDMATYQIKLDESLSKIRGMNQAFMSNDTFRDIVVNGTVNKENLLRLQKTHPVLSLFFNSRRMGGGDLEPGPEKIKLEIGEGEPKPEKENPKHLDYDVEYGILYY